MKKIPPLPYLSCFAALFLFGNELAKAAVGAVTLFTTLEAEDGKLNGGATIHTMKEPVTVAGQNVNPAVEASGRAFVELKGTGQSITWTNKTDQKFSAINIRFCIPDAPEGGGTTSALNLYVNGTFRQSVSLSSAQSWLYQNNGNKKPGPRPHKFFDETHLFITGDPVPPGGSIMLKQDAANNAAFYWIDVIDLETPPPPLFQPADSLSITDFGAVADDKKTDSTAAIQHCFDAARQQKKIAWIPKGTFYLTTTNRLNARDINIQGAGMWYSILYRNVPMPHPGNLPDMIDPVSCTLKNLAFDQNVQARDGEYGTGGGINIKGKDWLIDNVWVQHTSAGVWADGYNGTVINCRILSSWADGINLNNGNTGNDGNNLTARNNFIRGSGDDGLAINSDVSSHQMQHPVLINNTSVAPWWAHGIGIYGGSDILVKDNLICDVATNNGLNIGVFGRQGAALESDVVEGNVILRSGDQNHPGLSIGTDNEPNSIANVYVGSNTVKNSITRGVDLRIGSNVVVENNHVDGGGLPGFVIAPFAAGSGILIGNTTENISSGEPASLKSTSKYKIVAPIPATNFTNMPGRISTEACSEGGRDISNIGNGDNSFYPGLDLTGVTTFIARVASKGTGGAISIYLDKLSGTPVGTCTVPATGGAQNWSDVSCVLNGVSGKHDIYLVYSGAGMNLFGLKWVAFSPGKP